MLGRSRFAITFTLLCAAASPFISAAPRNAEVNLPELGEVSASHYSSQQEYELGRMWLKMFRTQVQTLSDPLLQSYLESTLYNLAVHSDLKDHRLDTVIVDNETINAFAVPGGVIGIHSGLFLFSDNEAQFAGVLAHELGHLSQRHFNRSIDKARESAIPSLAGMLAGIIIAATAGADAGIAAITATQAAALDNRLRFSREHEKEADRVGMETLARADMDPAGIPAMFENMNENLRYARSKPPEFLLTHPLTESRISDSKNRARQYQRKVYTDSLNFQLMKMRAELHHAKEPKNQLIKWQRATGANGEARRYGIVIALIELERWDEAEKQLADLLREDPGRIAYTIAHSDILLGQKKTAQAIAVLREELDLSPGNHPLTMQLAYVLEKSGRYKEADTVLSAHSERRPTDPALWYQLAEIRGLAGNILGVHMARAEYFYLNAQFDRAKSQLQYAYPLTGNNAFLQGKIKQRLREIDDMRKKLEEFK